MDFFQAQDTARARTRTLVVLFVAAVAAIIACIYLVVHMVIGPGPGGGPDLGLLLVVAALTTGLVAAGSTGRTMQLRQGGGRVAELLGGRRVRPDSSDEAERRLINVVEEMAIASGTPVPAIYVLDHEQGINAFAAGYTLDDAAVGVTRGTLDRLNRDELQGVIAHEFSHILNGDMRLNIRLMGLLFGILLLAVVGRGLLHSGARVGGGRGRRGGGGQVAIIGLALLLIGYIGVFFGRLIQAAVSRQREYLADAAAVQFTRSPDGLAGALRKIGATSSRLSDHHAQEAGHFFFANGIGSAFTSLLATHPPLDERIRRVDVSGSGHSAVPPQGEPGTRKAALPGAAPAAGAATFAGARLLASVGAPEPAHVACAGRLLDGLSGSVRAAAHEPERAVALLFALLVQPDEPHAEGQWQALAAHGGSELNEAVAALLPDVRAAGAAARLPLLDMLLPALRELSPRQQEAVRGTAERLVGADRQVDLFELALLHVLGRQLRQGRAGGGAEQRSRPRLRELGREVEVVLSAAAWSGAADAQAAHRGFEAGAAAVAREAGELELMSPEALGLEAVDGALDRLRGAAAGARRAVLEACTLAVAEDGQVRTAEAELLRAVAEAVDCPMPPAVP
jgi:Zn-dependent protease with chaperone function